MATGLSEVYDAFVLAGTPDDKARKPAGYERDIAGIRADLPVLKWMLALVLATAVPMLQDVRPLTCADQASASRTLSSTTLSMNHCG